MMRREKLPLVEPPTQGPELEIEIKFHVPCGVPAAADETAHLILERQGNASRRSAWSRATAACSKVRAGG
jgi:hypothetical protein